ncbi:hypothetical protein MNBD_GAMMA12-1218 [hydrothermal vent metagenome]|uniref:DUF2007 domain-containing protein n=1 Tax=hydrothermal vent metagenome TaxID=652676 RepID=A0A3B0YVM5_9ZZZZ
MLVTVAWFTNVLEAHIVKGRIESSGIIATIQNEHHVTLDWSLMLAMGFIRVQVSRTDVEQANKILKDIEAGEYDLEHNYSPEVEYIPDPVLFCPRCKSEDVSVGVNTTSWTVKVITVLLLDFIFEIILPLKNYNCRCNKSNFEWKVKKRDGFNWMTIVMIAIIFSLPLSLFAYYLMECQYTAHGVLCN